MDAKLEHELNQEKSMTSIAQMKRTATKINSVGGSYCFIQENGPSVIAKAVLTVTIIITNPQTLSY